MQLNGRVAIITGAASGIGRGSAVALSRAGAKVVIADINLDGANTVAGEINKAGGVAMSAQCDVGMPGAFEVLRDAILTRFDCIDIVMNNAGVIISGNPDAIPVSEWARVIDVNLMSVVRSNAAFLPLLLAQGSGHIVNTASFAGLYTYAFDRLPYAASKAALVQLSEGLALYLRPKGIGVTLLCPGPVRTNIMSSTRVFTSNLQMRGPGPEFALKTPEEVGALVVDAIQNNTFFLLTDPQVENRLMRRARDFNANLQDQIDNPHVYPAAKP